MADMNSHTPNTQPLERHEASPVVQFAAVVRKNLLLQLRGRRRIFGLAGWPALALEICVPALFFLVACIPKHYLKPMPSPLQLSPVYDLDSPAWGVEYEGPASARPSALIYYAPNSTAVSSLVALVAQVAACPNDSNKKRPTGSSFYRYFSTPDVPADCLEPGYCRAHEECWAPLLGSQFVGHASAELAVQAAMQEPETVDALVDFSAWQPAKRAGRDAADPVPAAVPSSDVRANAIEGLLTGVQQQRQLGQQQPSEQEALPAQQRGEGPHVYRYTLRLNHTEVPFTRMLLNEFDISPGNYYKQQWFLANLQALLDQAILAHASSQAPCSARAAEAGPAPAQCTPAGNSSLGAVQLLPLEPTVKPFPWPAGTVDLGATAAALFFTLLMTYAFLAPTRAAVGTVVQEKELLLREGMRILGLQDAAYWGSWALTHWAVMAGSGLLCALVGLYPFQHSSFGLMLAFYWLLSAALLGFAYCMSTLFASARVAGTAAAVLYALAMMPGWLMPSLQPYGGSGWAAACLLPPSAISLFAHVLVRQESAQRGLTPASLWQPVTVEGSFSAATVYGMLALDVLLYTLLLSYLDKVMPSQSAQPWPPHFFLLPSYWRRFWQQDGSSTSSRSQADGAEAGPLLNGSSSRGSQQELSAVDVRNLTKVFHTTDGSEKVAVDGLTLGIRHGEITALLGHNGAGKTTTIAIITGLLRPTSGDVFVAGLSVRKDIRRIRASLGVCPQFDVLWPDISVKEHLELAAALKGYPRSQRGAVAARAAEEVGLAEKLESAAGRLSGGQRRKLSVALAFVGDPAVVILDEPTSGMDPYTRRFTWDIIRKHRGGSAILLTTHSMEEADMLSDRIAIMADGKLAATGTSLDLKSRFGVGYTLTIARASPTSRSSSGPGTAVASRAGSAASLVPTTQQQPAESSGRMAGGTTTPTNTPVVSMDNLVGAAGQADDGSAQAEAGRTGDAGTALLLAAVRQHVPSAVLLSASAGEVAVRLPKEASAAFPTLLRHLEQQRQQLGVSSYGLSVTTLEEVFLRVSAGAGLLQSSEAAADTPAAAGSIQGATVDGKSRPAGQQQEVREEAEDQQSEHDFVVVSMPASYYLRGPALWRQQFAALFTKRALCAARDRTSALVQVAVPVLLVLLALYGSRASARFTQQPALELSRATALANHPAVLAASAPVRQNSSAALAAFEQAYPATELRDSGRSSMLKVPYFQPLTGTVDEYLLESWNDERLRAYDALYLDSLPDLAASTPNASSPLRFTILANQTAVHGLPASLNQMHSALLRWLTNDSSAAIIASNHPLPVVQGEAQQGVSQASGTLLLVLCVTMATAVLAASFAVFLVRERDRRSKAVQVIAGASPSAFWASTLAWDLLHFSVPAAGMLLCFPLFHLPQFTGIRLGAVAVLLWAFAVPALSQTYLLQWLFSDEMKALQRLSTLYYVAGFLGFLSTWMLDMIFMFMHSPSVHRTNALIKHTLQVLSPHFCLSRGIYEIMQTYKEDKGQPNLNPYAWEALGSYLASLAAQAVVFFALTLLVEAGVLPRIWHHAMRAGAQRGWWGSREVEFSQVRQPLLSDAEAGYSSHSAVPSPAGSAAAGVGTPQQEDPEDEDVHSERLAVQSGEVGPSNAAALLQGVSKTYWQSSTGQPVHAVRSLWLGMGRSTASMSAQAQLAVSHTRGECFGLLGVNGAGKTTSFSMLTGEVLPDSGEAFVAGHSLLDDPLAAHRSTGYCPQFSALPPQMTGREVLRMYARLRGLPARFVDLEVQKLLKQMGLGELANRVCGSYSGGNKRKLSVAVALIGRDSGLVCLDEPSTGVDPGARRALWEVIQAEQRSQKTVVLTSHSMEECEAVCSRLGIMAAGRLRCLGTVQHLKSRFGEGYTLHMRVDTAKAAEAEALVREHCTGAQLRERDSGSGHLSFSIPQEGLDLPSLFEALEHGCVEGSLEEYSLSQTTLEQVFLTLAKQQQQPHES